MKPLRRVVEDRAWAALALLALLASGCSATTSEAGDLDGAVAFDGASLGKCSNEDYVIIAADDCPVMGCLGSAAFALCEGASYSRCACTPPGAGWTLVDGGPVDGGQGDAGRVPQQKGDIRDHERPKA